MRRARRLIPLAMLAVLALAGCSDPYTATAPHEQGSVQAPGEPAAPPPGPAGSQAPADVQASPRSALLQFARRYSNWTYQSLSADQRGLAAISVGAARLAERQAAAASAADQTLRAARIVNRGQVLGITRDLARPGWWVIVTREQTSGHGEYEALPASIHVTLAKPVRVREGWVVGQWLPQT